MVSWWNIEQRYIEQTFAKRRYTEILNLERINAERRYTKNIPVRLGYRYIFVWCFFVRYIFVRRIIVEPNKWIGSLLINFIQCWSFKSQNTTEFTSLINQTSRSRIYACKWEESQFWSENLEQRKNGGRMNNKVIIACPCDMTQWKSHPPCEQTTWVRIPQGYTVFRESIAMLLYLNA
jgi:hypothetical protein